MGPNSSGDFITPWWAATASAEMSSPVGWATCLVGYACTMYAS